MIITGTPVIWGMGPTKPIVNLPEGARVRIRQRTTGITSAFVQTKFGVEKWTIEPTADGLWKLGFCEGRNKTVQ